MNTTLRHMMARAFTALWCLHMAAGCTHALWQADRPAHAPGASQAPETFAPAFWAALLVHEGHKDRMGAPICGLHTCLSPATRKAYVSTDVVLSPPSHTHPDTRVVWLKALREPGFDVGPVALVRVTPDSVAVLATGTLRLARGEAVLAYVDVHEFFAVQVTWTDCLAVPSHGGHCRRTMRLLPHLADRLVTGTKGATDVELCATHALPRSQGIWDRRIEHEATVELCQGTIILTEQAVLKAYPRKRAGISPRIVRQVEAVRSVRWEHGAWCKSDPPLWQMMAEAEGKNL